MNTNYTKNNVSVIIKLTLLTVIIITALALSVKYVIIPQIEENTRLQASKPVQIYKVAENTIYFDMREIEETKRSERFTLELASHTKGQSVITNIVAVPSAKVCPDGYLVTFEKSHDK
jgi:biopolymer transport protein ExbD